MTLAFEGVEEGDAPCPHCGKPVIYGPNAWYHVTVEDRNACPAVIERRKWMQERNG